ncbi:MAG: hypothetical protein MZU97_12230 [Bacillus subtilis]|nr:hypothetical protein [Bacillus subtilis]
MLHEPGGSAREKPRGDSSGNREDGKAHVIASRKRRVPRVFQVQGSALQVYPVRQETHRQAHGQAAEGSVESLLPLIEQGYRAFLRFPERNRDSPAIWDRSPSRLRIRAGQTGPPGSPGTFCLRGRGSRPYPVQVQGCPGGSDSTTAEDVSGTASLTASRTSLPNSDRRANISRVPPGTSTETTYWRSSYTRRLRRPAARKRPSTWMRASAGSTSNSRREDGRAVAARIRAWASSSAAEGMSSAGQ